MRLIEREAQLSELEDLLRDVAAGQGRLALISGEAGAGKSALIRAFAETAGNAVRQVWGVCDPITTPRPFGPLFDIARSTEGPLLEHLREGASLSAIYAAAFEALEQPEPTIVVVEDVHWIDQATLDFLIFLGRRLAPIRALVLVSYRDDELALAHPFRQLVGNLSTAPTTRRLSVGPLSLGAVATLAEHIEMDPGRLYELTGGNPFLVSEVIAAGGALSDSARDLLLGRIAQISPEALRLLEYMASHIGRFCRGCFPPELPEPDAVLTECLARGIVTIDGDWFAFRHELTRQAILDTIPQPRKMQIHRTLLGSIRTCDDSYQLACLVQHAEGAADASAVEKFGLQAAAHAAQVGAHREAAAHYDRVLSWAVDLAPLERGRILELAAQSHFLAGAFPAQIDLQQEALALYREIGAAAAQANALQTLSRYLWFAGRNDEAIAASDAAISAARRLPPGPELASALAARTRLHMVSGAYREAIDLGRQVLELCEQIESSPGTIAHALIDIGGSQLHLGDPAGLANMHRGLEIAIAHSLEDQTSRALNNLAHYHFSEFDLREAASHIERHGAVLAGREMEGVSAKYVAQLGELEVDRGNWEAAETAAESILDRPSLPGVYQFMSTWTLARVAARQGDRDAWATLDRATALVPSSADLQFIAAIRLVRIETLWIAGDVECARQELRNLRESVELRGDTRHRATVNYWSWKCGDPPLVSQSRLTPFDLQIAGAWQRAAEAWHALGFPFEAALARSEACDDASLLQALCEFNALGARPAAAQVQRRLRALGVTSVPRGPQTRTLANPAHLTGREVEVLSLLSRGLRNADIAAQLFISPKTVERHLSSIFLKLKVDNRAAAVSEVSRLGLPGFSEGMIARN